MNTHEILNRYIDSGKQRTGLKSLYYEIPEQFSVAFAEWVGGESRVRLLFTTNRITWRELLADTLMLRFDPDHDLFPFVSILHGDEVVAMEPLGVEQQTRLLMKVAWKILHAAGGTIPELVYYGSGPIKKPRRPSDSDKPDPLAYYYPEDIQFD